MRKTKSIVPYLIAIILLILGLLGYITFRQREKSPAKPMEFSLAVVHKKETTDLAAIWIEYPQFKGIEELNDQIAQMVNTRRDEFAKNIKENWEIRKKMADEENPLPDVAQPPYSFSVTWSPHQINPTAISFVMRTNAFEGGANEIQEIKTFNYNPKDRKPIALEELFPKNPTYLETISEYTAGDLIGQFQNDTGLTIPYDLIDEGTQPVLVNFSNFTFNDNTVVFYFPKYQVAPGSFGEQTVVMPRQNPE